MEKRLKRVKDVCDKCEHNRNALFIIIELDELHSLEHNHNTSMNSELGRCFRCGYSVTLPSGKAMFDTKSKEFLEYKEIEKKEAEEKKLVNVACPYKFEHMILSEENNGKIKSGEDMQAV